MHEELKTFLVGLAHDVEKLTAYISDPAGTLDGSRLSEEEKAILRSGDQNRIYAAVANLAPIPAAPQPQPQEQKTTQMVTHPPAYGQPPVPAPAAGQSAWGSYGQLVQQQPAAAAQQAYGWPAYGQSYGMWQWPQVQYAVIPWTGQ